jgi:hypothetical protein
MAEKTKREIELEQQIVALLRGIGSLLWVVNNVQNHDHPLWDNFVQSAKHDAREGMRAADWDG